MSLNNDSFEESAEVFVDIIDCLVLDEVWVIALLGVDVFNVVMFKSYVLEFPCLSGLLLELALVSFHVGLEFLLPSRLEVNLSSDFIRNVSKVDADLD